MPRNPPKPPRISRFGLLIALFFLAALVVYSVLHVGEARRFSLLAERAEPLWLLAAAGFQVGTYLCAGAIWGRVAATADHRLSYARLARLSVEKLSVDQFLPAGGLAGNFVVIGALRRTGLPAPVATEALLIDTISYYGAFAVAAALSVVVLWLHHGITPVIVAPIGVFAVLIAGVPLGIAWLLKHGDWKPSPRLARLAAFNRLLELFDRVSARRVWNLRLLGAAAALQIAIICLDASTLWAVLHALGTPVHPLTAFVAQVLASITAILSLLPGGIGSFEAACTATLAILGAPVEAALTGTFLSRGLTLWLPLVPGVLLAFAKGGAMQQLNDAIDLSKARPNVKFVLDVHADMIGTQEQSQNISLQRAAAIRRYLQGKNAEIQVNALGNSKPLGIGFGFKGKEKNNRVELRLAK